MSLRRRLIVLITATLIAPMVGAVEDRSSSIGIPFPDIPAGSGDSCVKDTQFMRRNHMNMLKHQRDDTVLKGMRGKQFSLKECIDCHAVSGPDATLVTAASPKHFCRSCHAYAAVKIDCFECHASRPAPDIAAIE